MNALITLTKVVDNNVHLVIIMHSMPKSEMGSVNSVVWLTPRKQRQGIGWRENDECELHACSYLYRRDFISIMSKKPNM